ncbi:MAG: DnaA ATPase domain-containing protein [Culicoidibacterales bacterium]
MKTIQSVIALKGDKSESMTKLLSELKANEEVMRFISANKMTEAAVANNILTFKTYLTYLDKLNKGVLLSGNSHLEGYLSLDLYNKVEFGYRYTADHEQLLNIRKFVSCWHMDEHMLKAEISDFSDNGRSIAAMKALVMVKRQIAKGVMPTKGLYISGANGVGKTHMLAAIAKAFYVREVKTIIVFFPELIRDLKQSPFTADKIIKQLQRVPVLMIDDIGSEMQTSFSRDEILLPILNARMNNGRLTFFTSNLDLVSLEHHFTHSQYGENEPIKAKRILERIHALSEYAPLLGENKRRIEGK